MLKILRLAAFIGISIIGIYIVARITGAFRIYNTATNANEPALKLNAPLMVSNIPNYKRGDFVVHTRDTITLVHRLIAVGGDTVQIKQGVAFVNGINIDKKLKLMHAYVIDENEYNRVKNILSLTPSKNVYGGNGQYIVLIEDNLATKTGISKFQQLIPQEESDPVISKIFGKNSNKDNIRPIILPDDKVFVLGDNRDNSEDSRYLGLIDLSEIEAVVLK